MGMSVNLVNIMASILNSNIPTPKDWQAFERMTRDAFELVWKSPNLQLNGRSGQNQDGVDIYGPDNLGRPVAIQCKNTRATISYETIEGEVKKAESFSGQLSALFIATTAERDARLQEKVRILSEERCGIGKFAVGLIYWDDIVRGLHQSPAKFNEHFPDILMPTDTKSSSNHQLVALLLGYQGCYLDETIKLVFGDFSVEDPDKLKTHLRNTRHGVKLLFPTERQDEIFALLDEISKEIFETDFEDKEGNRLILKAQRAGRRVSEGITILPKNIARALDIGSTLGHVWHNCDDDISLEYKQKIITQIAVLLPHVDSSKIEKTVLGDLKHPSGYNRASKIFNFVDNELRWTDI